MFKMHTTLVYEFYDENNEWFDIGDTINKKEVKEKTYLGDLGSTNIDGIISYLNRLDVKQSNKGNYKDMNIELLDTYCFGEVRSNNVMLYFQFKINTKFAADGTRIDS